MTLANFYRLMAGAPGKDVATQLTTRSLSVQGSEALVRALPSWFALPG